MDAVYLTFRMSYHSSFFASVQGSPLNIRPLIAGLVYIIMPIMVYLWAVRYATSFKDAAIRGAIVGFLSYAFYDLTNYATLTNWTLGMTIGDVLWGTILMSAAATTGFIFRN